jgi:beta-lactamase regulating signal transducer with metallopeptidase domain
VKGVAAMDKLFLTILNMSLTGAFVVAAICLARLPIKKAPKIISYCLWAVAWFRFAFPFSIESVYSLIPFKAQTIPADIATQAVPRIDSGIPLVNNAVSSVLSSPTVYPDTGALPPTLFVETSMNPLQIWTAIGAWVWLAGAAIMLLCGVAFYLRLKHRMSSAIRVEGNVYETDGIRSPFILGVFKPKIYIPLDIAGQEREYIILHERTHIRRHDHIIKFAAYFILCLHWFNPLAWAAFLLMGVDMEMSCDERVLQELGGEIKNDYSLSLLSLAAGRRIISGSPLAFGEDGVKMRIKNVLKFKKSSRFKVALAIAFVMLLSLGLVVSKASSGELFEAQVLEGQTKSVEAGNEYKPPAIAEEILSIEIENDYEPPVIAAKTISVEADKGNQPLTTEVQAVSMVAENGQDTPALAEETFSIETNNGYESPTIETQTTSIEVDNWYDPPALEEQSMNMEVDNLYNPPPLEEDNTSTEVVYRYDPPTIEEQTKSTDTDNGSSDNGFEPDYVDPGSGVNAGKTYIITDYYNDEDGKFSPLGLGLYEKNSEKVLSVSSGDTLIVDGRRFEVTAESLTLSFYTQPSLDQAIRWWANYLDSWADSGKVTVVN